MLRLINIKKQFRNQVLFRHLTLELQAGVDLIVTGASGSGKSTLLYLLDLLIQQDQGVLKWQGEVIDKLNTPLTTRLRRSAISLATTAPLPLLPLTVKENLELARGLCHRPSVPAMALLISAEIGYLAARRIQSLSGGERQRVGLLMALIKQPDLFLLDEPTSALDQKTGQQFLRLIRRVAPQSIKVIATHDQTLMRTGSHHLDLDANTLTENPGDVNEEKLNLPVENGRNPYILLLNVAFKRVINQIGVIILLTLALSGALAPLYYRIKLTRWINAAYQSEVVLNKTLNVVTNANTIAERNAIQNELANQGLKSRLALNQIYTHLTPFTATYYSSDIASLKVDELYVNAKYLETSGLEIGARLPAGQYLLQIEGENFVYEMKTGLLIKGLLASRTLINQPIAVFNYPALSESVKGQGLYERIASIASWPLEVYGQDVEQVASQLTLQDAVVETTSSWFTTATSQRELADALAPFFLLITTFSIAATLILLLLVVLNLVAKRHDDLMRLRALGGSPLDLAVLIGLELLVLFAFIQLGVLLIITALTHYLNHAAKRYLGIAGLMQQNPVDVLLLTLIPLTLALIVAALFARHFTARAFRGH